MKALIDKRKAIFESSIPDWVKRAAKSKVVVGPNGNKAIAYEWKWMWDEVFDEREDGMVSAKVSDWDEALTCASCNRRIVHIYWVEMKDGEILPYGGDHLHIALGYPRQISKAQLEKLRYQVTEKKRAEKEDKELRIRYELYIKKRGAPDVGGANRLFFLSAGKKRPGARVIFLFNKKKKLIMRGDDLAVDRFLKYTTGWKIEDPETIRKILGKEAV